MDHEKFLCCRTLQSRSQAVTQLAQEGQRILQLKIRTGSSCHMLLSGRSACFNLEASREISLLMRLFCCRPFMVRGQRKVQSGQVHVKCSYVCRSLVRFWDGSGLCRSPSYSFDSDGPLCCGDSGRTRPLSAVP